MNPERHAFEAICGPEINASLRRRLFLALVVAIGLVAGCQTAPPDPATGFASNAPGPGTAHYATNLLQEGDVVSITFQYATNFNALQKITLDGMLNLEGAGQVKAAGLAPMELQAQLATLYKPQTKDDVITVKVVGSISSVYVAGAVFRPGKIPMEHPLTVLEAVIEAGGYDPNRANLADVRVLRIEGGRQHTYRLNLKKILQGEDETPFYLRPFDIVHIPAKVFNF